MSENTTTETRGGESGNFDTEAFCEWLDEQEGYILRETMKVECPSFPFEYLAHTTQPITEDGEFAYFQRDLRRAADCRLPHD